MDFTDEQMRRFQEAADRGRRRYEQRRKMEESIRRKELRRRQRELGIKVIRGGKASE